MALWELTWKDRNLYHAVSEIFLRHDPIGIYFEGADNWDEYDPEVGTLLPELEGCASEVDVRGLLHLVFVHWFGADLAGPESRYKEMAKEIWKVWVHQRTCLYSPAPLKPEHLESPQDLSIWPFEGDLPSTLSD